jgi:hypothetical protein
MAMFSIRSRTTYESRPAEATPRWAGRYRVVLVAVQLPVDQHVDGGEQSPHGPLVDGWKLCRALVELSFELDQPFLSLARHAVLARASGLEPVTPSLSTRSSVRVSSLMFAQSTWLSGISRRANT